MKKVLMVSTVASMIELFNMSNINILQNLGINVEIACNFDRGNNLSIDRINNLKSKLDQLNIKYHNLPVSRNPLAILRNYKSYKYLLKISNKNKYSFIHGHTPIGGMLARLIAYKCNTKVIYTAHGFHFFKGASLISWLIYYPVEYLLSKITDILILINKEDYNLAKSKFEMKNIYYIPGVGVDINKIDRIHVNKNHIRESLNIPIDGILLVSVGELNRNKNHIQVINSLSRIKNPNIYYIICGVGLLKNELESHISELNLNNNIKLIGFRNDIVEILKASDAFVLPSKREGLSVALLEALSCDMRVICSRIRGTVDVVNDEYLFSNNEELDFLLKDVLLLDKSNLNFLYSCDSVNKKMKEIYLSLL